MFNDNVFVSNVSVTSDGTNTFYVPESDKFSPEEVDFKKLAEIQKEKNKLFYYKAFEWKLEFKKTFNFDVVFVSLHIGDIIDFITRMTGIKKLIVKLTNGNCGCEARRKKFNKWFALPLIKIWFSEHDMLDQYELDRKYQKSLRRKLAAKQRMLQKYEEVKENIIEQAEIQSKSNSVGLEDHLNRMAAPKTPAPGGCGCGQKMKKTVTYL